jgi:hypothetical protein
LVFAERRRDAVAARLEPRLTLALVDAERLLFVPPAGEEVAEEAPVGDHRGDTAVRGPVAGDLDRFVDGRVARLRRDRSEFGHLAQDPVPALQRLRLALLGHRVERARCLRQAGQQRRLLQRQVLRLLAEVDLARGVDAVGAVAERRDVQVVLEDLQFRHVRFEGERKPDLAELARVGLLGRGDHLGRARRRVRDLLPHVLHGEGRSALGRRALLVRHEGPHDALQVDALVVEEALVLRGEDRVLHDLRHVGERDVVAVLVVERGEERLVVGCVDVRDLWRRRRRVELGR